MNKIFSIGVMGVLMMTMMTMSVLAYDQDATQYSVRKTITNEDGNRIGQANAWLNLQRGVSGSGYVWVQLNDCSGKMQRVSINWDAKGNNYGMTVLEDTADYVKVQANTRIIWGTFGIEEKVPMNITYFKNSTDLLLEGASVYVVA